MVITRADIVKEARKLLGVRWRHQGLEPEFGIDCRGELLVVADRTGFEFKDYNKRYRRRAPAIELRAALDAEFIRYWQRQDQEVIPVEIIDDADVVLIHFPRDDDARHVGILARGLYEMMIIHAYEPAYGGGKVVEEPFRRWQPYVVAAYSWPI